MSLLLLNSPACLGHRNRPQHAESPERLEAVLARLNDDGLSFETAPPVTREQLLLGHSRDYLDSLDASQPASGLVALDADTDLGPASLAAASHASGAVTHGIERLLDGSATRVFCATRPPGHHAAGDRAAGFCLYNHIAIGALYARQKGFERVAIMDFDVHHGDGTEAIVAGRAGIRLHSSFQHPLYPWTGLEPSADNIHNMPIDAHSDGQVIRDTILPAWQASLADFRPDLMLVSAGFDAHERDPLAQLEWQTNDFALLARWLRQKAEQHSHGRILAVMEGGYDVAALSESVSAFVDAWR